MIATGKWRADRGNHGQNRRQDQAVWATYGEPLLTLPQACLLLPTRKRWARPLEILKKGRDWRITAKGGPAIALTLMVLLLIVHRFLF